MKMALFMLLIWLGTLGGLELGGDLVQKGALQEPERKRHRKKLTEF